MKYFTSQRLNSKNHHLDKFDLLDEHPITTKKPKVHCLLTNQEGNKILESLTTTSKLSNHLLLEWFSCQRVKYTVIKGHFSKITTFTTLRKDKLLNLLDNCLSSKFLTDEIYLRKSTNLFESILVLNTTPNNTLPLGNTTKLLPPNEIKIFLSYKPSCNLVRYFV